MTEKIARMRQMILRVDLDGLPEEQQQLVNDIFLLANEISMEVEGQNALTKSMQAYTEFYTNLSEQMNLNQRRFEKSAERFLNVSLHRRKAQQNAMEQPGQEDG